MTSKEPMVSKTIDEQVKDLLSPSTGQSEQYNIILID